MYPSLIQQLTHDLLFDLQQFLTVSIPLGIALIFFTAGAKIMEIKGYQKWPAIFAVLPLFWIILGFFDSKPENAGLRTRRLALVFGPLSVLAISLAFIYL